MSKDLELIEEETSSERLLNTLIAKRKVILYSTLAVVVALSFIYRFVDGKSNSYEQAIMEAKATEKALLSDSSADYSTLLSRLSEITQSYPELAPAFTPLANQLHLLLGEGAPAEQSLASSSGNANLAAPLHFRSFTDASILITKGQLNEAMDISEKLSLALDQTLNEDKRAASPLYLMNIARLAFLYQSLNQTSQERQQWKKLLSLLEASKQQNNPITQRITDLFHSAYSDGSISLINYAKSRIN